MRYHFINFNFQYISDVYFLHGVQRAIFSRVNSKSGGKTFFYRFDCDTGLNLIKKWVKMEKFKGAAHWDDFPYLWWPDPAKKYIDSLDVLNELKLVNKMVNIFTSFVIEGTTLCEETEEVGWEPIESTEHPLKCLSICERPLEIIELPETERLKIWDEVFVKAKADLF